MTSSLIRRLLYATLVLLFVLHNDLWLWDDATRWLGLPAGLTYHLLFCAVTTCLLWLLVRHAWPSHLASGGATDGGDSETGGA